MPPIQEFFTQDGVEGGGHFFSSNAPSIREMIWHRPSEACALLPAESKNGQDLGRICCDVTKVRSPAPTSPFCARPPRYRSYDLLNRGVAGEPAFPTIREGRAAGYFSYFRLFPQQKYNS